MEESRGDLPGAPDGKCRESGPGTAVVPGRELNILVRTLRKWIAAGEGMERTAASLVGLVGEAGCGKSMLIETLGEALRKVGLPSARASCHRERIPFEPIRTLLSGVLGGEGARAGEALRALAPEIHRLVPQIRWPWPVEPAASLGIDLDRSRFVDALARAFAERAREEPLVLLLDDLQWIDRSSLDVLAAVRRIGRLRSGRADPPRVLIISALAPEGREALAEIAGRRFPAFEVEVRGYSRDDVRRCSEALGLRLPLSAREALHRATGGNPFQVRFHLAAMRRRRDGDPVLPPEGLPSADGFRKMVLDGIRDLPDAARRALRVLALLGRPFPLPTASRLAGLGGPAAAGDRGPATQQVLTDLLAAGWIRKTVLEDGVEGLTLDGPFADILRSSMTPAHTAQLHAAIGAGLLAEGPDPAALPAAAGTAPMTLVFHHLARGGTPPRLVEAGAAAAREAESCLATFAAIEAYERALEGIDPGDKTGTWTEIAERLAARLEEAGADREAIEIHRKLAGVAAKPGGAEERARRLRKIGDLHGRLGEAALQVASYREALSVLGEGAGGPERVKLHGLLARLAAGGGGEDEDGRMFADGFRGPDGMAGDPQDREVQAIMEEVKYRRGDHAGALALEKTIFERAAAAGDVGALLRSASHLAHLHSLAGSPGEGRRFFCLGLEKAVAAGSRITEAGFLARIGRLLRASGDGAAALDSLRKAEGLLGELGREEELAGIQRSLVHLHLSLHDFEGAARTLEAYEVLPAGTGERGAAEDLAAPAEDREARARVLAACRKRIAAKSSRSDPGRVLAVARSVEILVDEGRLAEAGKLHEETMAAGEPTADPVTMARLLQGAGRLRRIIGDRGRALFLFQKSLDWLGNQPEERLLGNAYLEVASIFLVQGEGGRAYDCLLRGLRLYLELGDDRGVCSGLVRLVEFLREVGLRQLAFRFAGIAADFARKASIDRWQAHALCLRAALASEAGDLIESERSFRKARGLFDALGLKVEGLWLDLERGWERYRREDYPNALRIARAGIDSAREMGVGDSLEDFLFLLGAVESALSNRSKNFLRALDILDQALRGAQERGRPSVEAQVLLSIANIYEERGKEELGGEYRSRARAIVDRLATRLPAAIRVAAEKSRASEEKEFAPA